jgi:hypothetical protein
VLPTAASAHATTHTLTFTSVQQASVQYSSTVGGSEDKDLNKAGKVIGFDVARFVFNPQTNTISIGVAITNSGGFLYGALHQSASSPVSHGTVTGGTGIYAGATGTITGTSNQAGIAPGGAGHGPPAPAHKPPEPEVIGHAGCTQGGACGAAGRGGRGGTVRGWRRKGRRELPRCLVAARGLRCQVKVSLIAAGC